MTKQIVISTGAHAGHTATIESHDHNCGAWDGSISCSCGATYETEMNGCWQFNHQRLESGDRSLYDGTVPSDWEEDDE